MSSGHPSLPVRSVSQIFGVNKNHPTAGNCSRGSMVQISYLWWGWYFIYCTWLWKDDLLRASFGQASGKPQRAGRSNSVTGSVLHLQEWGACCHPLLSSCSPPRGHQRPRRTGCTCQSKFMYCYSTLFSFIIHSMFVVMYVFTSSPVCQSACWRLGRCWTGSHQSSPEYQDPKHRKAQ